MAMASAGAAVAATDAGRALMAAALALPGIVPAAAMAQSAPDQALFEFSYLNYRDWQPGRDRMTVHAPSLYTLLPLSDTTVFEAAVVYDQMSGASPLYFNVLSGASIGEYRTAGDVKFTKYFGSYAVSLGGAISSETDFLSRAAAATLQLYSDDRNRTWTLGIAGTNDRINSNNGVAVDQSRNSLDFMVGVTQALSPNAIVQSNLTYYTGRGYYSDPYKTLDTRPDRRRVTAWLTRYNQYVPAADATLRLGYRLLFDSFGGNTNMVEAAWAQALPHGFTVTPLVRYTTQSAASFYFNPPFPRGFVEGQYYSADTRLAAFGAFTGGVTVGKVLWDGWRLALRADYYQQNPDWRLGGSGSPGIQTFHARWLEVTLARTF